MHQLGFSFEILTLLVIILQCEFYNGLQNEYNNSNDLQDIQRQQTDSYLVSSGNRHVLNKRAIIFIKRIRKFRRLFISTCCGSESQTLLTCKRPIRETSTTSLMSSVITRSIAIEDTTEESDTDPPATAALSKAVTSAITTTMKITDTVTITTTVIPSTSTTITTTTTVPTTPTTTPTTMTTIPTTTTTTTPTTTRCKAICPTCSSGTDLTLLNSDGSIKDPSSYGTWITACNTLYLLSKDQATNEVATNKCCKLGMELWSFENEKELQCVYTANNVGPKFDDIVFWTSLTDQGCTDNGKLIWTWCRTQSPLNQSWWIPTQPDNHNGDETCATIVIKNVPAIPAESMNDIKCDKTFNYICQGPTTTSTSTTTTPPPATTTRCMASCPACGNKDSSLFNTDGSLINPSNYGSWLTACDNLYLFSNDEKSNADAASVCCRLGMQLWSIESQAEMQCIHDANLATTKQSGPFWLSLTDVGCTVNGKLVWTWCRTQNGLGASWWRVGEPNNDGGNEECGTIDIASQQALPATSMNDIACSRAFKYVCQGPTTTTTTTTTPPPPTTTRCMASCPACGNKDTSLFNTDGSLINPSNYGSWLTACNTLYLFSNDAKSNADAAAMCCKLGMQLWSIESQAEMQCIHDANFATTKLSERFWLSLTDVGCTVNGKLVWTWCRTQNGLGASWWFAGEPNNDGGNEECGTIDIASQQALPATSMNDIACSKPFKYVCQGPPTPSSGRK